MGAVQPIRGKIAPLPSPVSRPEYKLAGQGQLQFWVRSYAPFKTFGGGYDGDDRGPSTDTTDTSRIAYVLTFDYGSMKSVATEAFCSRSRGTGFLPRILAYTAPKAHFGKGGVVEGEGTVNHDTVFEPLGRPGSGLAACARMSAAVPLVGVAAAIDIQVSVTFKKGWNDALIVEGNVLGDAFPNCEVFLRDAAGDSTLLHSFRTRGGHGGPYKYLPGQNFRLMGAFKKVLLMNPIGLIGA